MKPSALLVGPMPTIRPLADALAPRIMTALCGEPERARLLIQLDAYQAVAIVHGAVPGEPCSIAPWVIVIPADITAHDLHRELRAAVLRRQAEERRRAESLVGLSSVGLTEYLEAVRSRATREYLLGLMRRHRGSVTAAAASAGLVRESLHRLLRRNDIAAHDFRDAPPSRPRGRAGSADQPVPDDRHQRDERHPAHPVQHARPPRTQRALP